MIRFEAGTDEIAALLTFLRRRAPRGKLLIVPLPTPPEVAPKTRRRPLKTPRPVIEALKTENGAHCFGILFPAGETPLSLTSDDCLMQLFFSPADTGSRRAALLEVRDTLIGDPPVLTTESSTARDLGERMARRLRRRGTRDGNQWHLPD